MNTLRRALYVQAAVWAVAGLALAVAPRVVLVSVFGLGRYREYAWVRISGVEALGLAMVAVMIAHRVEELWWWAWGSALVTVGVTAVGVLHAAIGLAPGQSSSFWWLFAVIQLLLSVGLLFGLFVSSREQPIP